MEVMTTDDVLRWLREGLVEPEITENHEAVRKVLSIGDAQHPDTFARRIFCYACALLHVSMTAAYGQC